MLSAQIVGARGARTHVKSVGASGITDFECSWDLDVDLK